MERTVPKNYSEIFLSLTLKNTNFPCQILIEKHDIVNAHVILHDEINDTTHRCTNASMYSNIQKAVVCVYSKFMFLIKLQIIRRMVGLSSLIVRCL